MTEADDADETVQGPRTTPETGQGARGRGPQPARKPARRPAAAGSPKAAAAPKTAAARAAAPKTSAPKTSATRAAAPKTAAAAKAAAAAKTATPKATPTKATPAKRTPKSPAAVPAAPEKTTAPEQTTAPETTAPAAPAAPSSPVVLSLRGLVKRYGSTVAVEGLDLDVHAGTFFGIVGPNGAGKTTTLSIATGLLRPDAGTVEVLGNDVWSSKQSRQAKRSLGVLPDRLRLFDRLTGAQFLYYAGTLRGLDGATARKRSADLAEAFGLQDALGRLVSDYSAGMTKKMAIAAAIIHSPRVLVLDEPFESVDPVSAATVTEILQRYVRGGGTVLLSSHSMDLVERICDSVAVIVDGHVLAKGTVHDVRAGRSLQERFVELAGGQAATEGLEWLHSFSD